MFCHCCSVKLVHLLAGGPTGTGATSTTYSGTSSFGTSRTTCGVYAIRSISGPLAIWLYRTGEHPPDSGKQATAVEPGWWQPLGLQQWKLVHTIESGWIAAEGAADPPLCKSGDTTKHLLEFTAWTDPKPEPTFHRPIHSVSAGLHKVCCRDLCGYMPL